MWNHSACAAKGRRCCRSIYFTERKKTCLQRCRCTKPVVSWRASAVKGYLILRKFAYIEMFTVITYEWDRDFNWTVAAQWNPSTHVVTIYVAGYVRDFRFFFRFLKNNILSYFDIFFFFFPLKFKSIPVKPNPNVSGQTKVNEINKTAETQVQTRWCRSLSEHSVSYQSSAVMLLHVTPMQTHCSLFFPTEIPTEAK